MAKSNEHATGYTLPSEQPVIELEKQIAALERRDNADDFAQEFEGRWLRAYGALGARGYAAVRRIIEGLYRTHGPEGAMARTRPSSYMALWMTVLLSAFLLLSFL